MGLFDKFKKSEKTNQWDDAYKANPHFYSKDDGSPFGAFALTEDIETILLKDPRLAVDGKEITDYKLMLVSTTKDGVIGDVDYFEALSKLDQFKLDENENEILIKALALEELESLIEKSSLQIAFEENLKYISSDEKDADVINRQFQKSETRYFLTVGTIDCPTGEIMIGDPLAYMPRFSPILADAIQAGSYPIEVAICRSEELGIRMAAVRMKITENKATRYQLAKPTEESAAFKASDGVACGFPVEAGMLSICDVQVANEYDAFLQKWHQENEHKNHYDDYFAQLFKESEERLPQYQREGGDFIEWENPDTHHRLVMVASGFGDGFYQFYWGYDNNDERCELIIPLINPDLFGV